MPEAANTERVLRSSGYETKFVFDRAQTRGVLGVLRARALPDAEYPASIISSIYFDTPDLRCFDEKDNSDFLKSKIRLRWYGDPESGVCRGHVFLEIKAKEGSRRHKRRLQLDWHGAELAGISFADPRFLELRQALRAMGETSSDVLLPTIEVNYRRFRFRDPRSGSSVCVDTDIRSGRANPLSFLRNPTPLASSVLEVKGQTAELPETLSSVLSFGCRRASFSKYHACAERTLRRSSLDT